MRNMTLTETESCVKSHVTDFDKARQEMLSAFRMVCSDKRLAEEEIEATRSAMASLLALQSEGDEI